MKNQIEDGGPAFPISQYQNMRQSEGLSIRDWMAGQALIGYIQDSKITGAYKIFSQHAYAMADAMLVARERK